MLHSQEMLFLEARKLCYKVKIMRFLKCVFFAIFFFFAQHNFFQTISIFGKHTIIQKPVERQSTIKDDYHILLQATQFSLLLLFSRKK